jgi:hypothetical protein
MGELGRRPSQAESIGRSIAFYAATLVIVAALITAGVTAQLHHKQFQPAQGAEFLLTARMARYERTRSDYDVVFFGDSRTYCGIHPEVIDPILGSRSINLSSFAHWFATQYPQALDLARLAPPQARVVWSIGHQNFFMNDGIKRKYPIGPLLAARYSTWGVPSDGLWDDVFFFTPGLQPLAMRSNWVRSYKTWLDRPLGLPRLVKTAEAAAPDPLPITALSSGGSDADRLLVRLQADPRVSSAKLVIDDGRVNSVVANMKGGGYYRIETDPEYFRRKQREYGSEIHGAASRAGVLPEPHPGYWRLFEETLNAFKSANTKLIVNELEEAPYTYGSALERERWRKYMREHVQPKVEAAGFPYVRTNLDLLENADYFDYNHLNSRGIHKYAALLAEVLRPHLATGRR